MSIQTVLGRIPAQDFGIILPHEHLALDYSHFHFEPPLKDLSELIAGPISLQNVGFVRQYPYASKFNLNFADNESLKGVKRDLELFKKFGGSAIVENSSIGLRTNLDLKALSKEAGVHIVAGAGHYLGQTQPSSVLEMSTEALYESILNDFQNLSCGVIAEVASDYPISNFEKNTIKATAEAQQQLKCGVGFHPGRHLEAPFEIVRLYLEAGGDAKKCSMSHLDRTLLRNEETLFEFAKLGVYLQFDLFGTECSYYQLNPTFDMPSDGDRINMLMKLVAEGYEKRVLMSHDIHTKHRLTSFGGHGYHHIITNVLPRMKAKGLSQEMIDTISRENPKQWLLIENVQE
ncbi:phosphotriesterase-related protein [Culicoides brevitarsis]|uniref:phosphotriesterase-related protein n=1 Tax=Culicoides brevitarsis TaxID=469753 RepID=UPI00307C4FC7